MYIHIHIKYVYTCIYRENMYTSCISRDKIRIHRVYLVIALALAFVPARMLSYGAGGAACMKNRKTQPKIPVQSRYPTDSVVPMDLVSFETMKHLQQTARWQPIRGSLEIVSHSAACRISEKWVPWRGYAVDRHRHAWRWERGFSRILPRLGIAAQKC